MSCRTSCVCVSVCMWVSCAFFWLVSSYSWRWQRERVWWCKKIWWKRKQVIDSGCVNVLQSETDDSSLIIQQELSGQRRPHSTNFTSDCFAILFHLTSFGEEHITVLQHLWHTKRHHNKWNYSKQCNNMSYIALKVSTCTQTSKIVPIISNTNTNWYSTTCYYYICYLQTLFLL